MIVYFAGWEVARSLLTENHLDKVKNILSSYYYIKSRKDLLEEWKNEGKQVVLDSGAFSAHSQKLEISLEEYMQFIRKNQKFIHVYVSLDSIGSEKESIKNYDIMLEQGLNPLPCFHYNEDYKTLDYYLSETDYVGLGGMVGINLNQKMMWLDKIFTRYPKTKFHGFGMTAYKLLQRYPWYSVDSTSWTQGGRLGKVILPDGRYLNFSRKKATKGVELFNKTLKEYYPKIDIEKAYEDYKYRNIINVLSFLKIEKILSENPPVFKNKQKTLF